MRLDLFSQKRLHEALTEAGHAVSLRTVRRWIEGDQEPSSAWRDVIAEVVGTTKEAAPPEWAERLAERMAERVIEALAPAPVSPSVAAALPRLIAALEASQPPDSEGTPARNGTEDPVEQSQATREAGLSRAPDE